MEMLIYLIIVVSLAVLSAAAFTMEVVGARWRPQGSFDLTVSRYWRSERMYSPRNFVRKPY